MSLTVNSYIVADVKVQHVFLERLIGAYSLTFSLSIKVNPRRDVARWLTLHGARIRVRTGSGGYEELGYFRPTQPSVIRQIDFLSETAVPLAIVLQPRQLTMLEDLRDAVDLDFELIIAGEGGVIGEAGQSVPVQETMITQIARSDWVKKLRDVKALDILLLEVPMPIADATTGQRRVVEHLQAAQKYFVEGHYKACVGECREVFDALGPKSGALKPLSDTTQREAMGKEQREDALFAAIRHYTQPAHHSATQPVPATYNRGEAKLLLHLTAACAAYGNGS